MQSPLFVRSLTTEEQATLEAGLRSWRGFTVRRCQMLLASVAGQSTTIIARTFRCNDQTVRNAIHDFHQCGPAALRPKSSRPHTTQATFDSHKRERLRALLHQSPRAIGREHQVNVWMMRQLQDMGHTVPFLIGDVTTRVGDPTGRNTLRPRIPPEEIEANAQTFLAQARMVLRCDDPDLYEVRRNSEW